MPSLLSRFLGKRKNADPNPLLDGEKYEAVPKTPSPSAPTFPESLQRTISPSSPPKTKSKDHSDKSLGINIRRKQASSAPVEAKANAKLPLLSLSLPDTKLSEKKSQDLGAVFAGIADGPPRLDDEVLGATRLTPNETLTLVQKTSEVISERALGTLGVMRPHWFASSHQQEIQLQLISRFLQSLSSSKSNASASDPTSPSTTFESELRYTRDPHDVAAVLRWGLRHIQLDGNSFSSSSAVDWYRSFVDSERSGSYPSKAFDTILVPLLPASHSQLLRAILDLVSSLSAHSEENGISGNKLSKVLGWWIISSRNVQGLGWREFYAQWEAAARQFEHLFLAYIRAQEAQSRMPKRLTELIKNYPFAKNRREEDGIFLPRSRFSTRRAAALLVRITVDKSSASSRPHPLRIVEDAFNADAEGDLTGEYVALWHSIRKAASKSTPSGDESKEKSETASAEASLNLSSVLADETIRLLSLVAAPNSPSGPTSSLFTPLPGGHQRRPLSTGDTSPSLLFGNGGIQGSSKDASFNDKPTGSPSTFNREPDVATDWQAFSNAGFRSPSGLSLAASLWDNDTEVSQPPKKTAGAGKRNLSVKSGSPRRASADSSLPPLPTTLSTQPSGRLTYGAPQVVRLDEAFIDFWADTLLDTIARSWPTFVVCQLKTIQTLRLGETDKAVEWLVIERALAEPTPPPVKTSATSTRAASPTPASPTKSESSKGKWTAATLAATRKRWSIFPHKHESAPVGKGGRDSAVRKAAKDVKVGEMGEILQEEDEGQPNGVTVNGKSAGSDGTKGANGVNHSETVVEKKAVISPLPTIYVDSDFKLEDHTAGNAKEADAVKVATVTVAEPTSNQDLADVVKQASEEPKQAVEASGQPTQSPVIMETIPEPQPVIDPAPKEEPAAESVPQESTAAAESVPAPKESQIDAATTEVEDLQTLPKTNEAVSQPPASNVPDLQSLDAQVPEVAAAKIPEGPQVSVTSSVQQVESTQTPPVSHEAPTDGEHPSSTKDPKPTKTIPAPINAEPSTETATTPNDAEGFAQPEATFEQPLSEMPSMTDLEVSPSETLAADSIVPESRHENDRDVPTSVERAAAEEAVTAQPEAVHVPVTKDVPENTIDASVRNQDIVAATPEPAAEVEEVNVEEPAEEQSVEPTVSVEVPAEPDVPESHDTDPVPADEAETVNDAPVVLPSNEAQAEAEPENAEPDVPEDHDAEPVSDDKDEVLNAEPVVLPPDEVPSEIHAERPTADNTIPAVDDEAAVVEDVAEAAP